MLPLNIMTPVVVGQGYSCLGSSKILNFVYLVKALYSSSLPANEQPKAKRPTSHAGVNWKPKYGQIIGMSKIHLFSGIIFFLLWQICL